MPEVVSGLGKVQKGQASIGLTRINRVRRDLSFSEVLKSRLEQQTGITFSAHTVERLRERGITLSAGELERLSGAVLNADEKGAGDSLILIDNNAFIVSIKNRTVITAMTGDSIKDNVFTNIDSAVIA